MMPELIKELRQDYSETPLCREIVLLDSKGCVYNGGGVFLYYRSTHPHLDSMFQILENHGLVTDIQWNSVERYQVSERLAEYLTKN
jgi:hypothetical protein